MRAQPKGVLCVMEWRSKHTQPPAGQPRILLQGFALGTASHQLPPEIRRKLTELGPNCGYGVSYRFIDPPAKRRSPEQKAAQRQRNLIRRVERTTGPMFALGVIREELQKRPEYFAGAESEPEAAAYANRCDEHDRQLYAEFLNWYRQQARLTRPCAPWWEEAPGAARPFDPESAMREVVKAIQQCPDMVAQLVSLHAEFMARQAEALKPRQPGEPIRLDFGLRQKYEEMLTILRPFADERTPDGYELSLRIILADIVRADLMPQIV